jgi:hypothetical protein
MNLEEFINTDPNFYGRGNANLFYSSSISGSDDTPVAPFTLLGMSVPLRDLNGNNLVSPLKEVDKFKFDFAGQRVEVTINGRQKKNTYFFFSFDPLVVNNIPEEDSPGTRIEEDSEFVFFPYFESSYFNSDYNPFQGSAQELLKNSVIQVVDRNTSQAQPTNLAALVAGTAGKAQIPDSKYETAGIISGKYLGAKLTSAPTLFNVSKDVFKIHVDNNGVPGSEPALSFKLFEGSIHRSDADTTTIKGLSDSDREKIEIYFDSRRQKVGGLLTFPNFPNTSNILYVGVEGSNDLRKAVDSKIYSIETDQVFTTDEDGIVTSIT